jgi:hypothetical protein
MFGFRRDIRARLAALEACQRACCANIARLEGEMSVLRASVGLGGVPQAEECCESQQADECCDSPQVNAAYEAFAIVNNRLTILESLAEQVKQRLS